MTTSVTSTAMRSLWMAAALIACGFVAPVSAAETATAFTRIIAWDASKDGDPKTYAVGDFRITLASGKATGDGTPPMLTVQSARDGRQTITGAVGPEMKATVLIAGLDPKADGAAVVLQTYGPCASGCTRIDILDPVGGRWKRVHAGQWDGQFSVNLQHLAGDSLPYVQLYDDDFLFAFACHACAAPPPRVFTLVGGEWRDVSTAAKYAPVFRRNAQAMRPLCAGGDGGGQNGYCAAYLADAARLGELDQAWVYMLGHYDRTDTWDWPTGCAAPRTNGECPKGRTVVFKTFPDALRNFLKEKGYVPVGAA